MKVNIEWCDQFFHYHHFQQVNHLPSARRIASERARRTGKKHRLTDENGALLDLMIP